MIGDIIKAVVSITTIAVLLAVSGCESYQPPSPAPQPAPTPAPVPPPPASPSSSIVDRYSLEIAAWGPSCEAIPEHARRRTYSAEIHDLGDKYAVKLFDALFFANRSCFDSRLPQPQFGTPSCNQFLASREGDMWSFHIGSNDEWDGNEIWERLSDGYLLQIIGDATGRVEDGEIQAMGPGGFWYANGRPATHSVGCRTDHFRLTFSPR